MLLHLYLNNPRIKYELIENLIWEISIPISLVRKYILSDENSSNIEILIAGNERNKIFLTCLVKKRGQELEMPRHKYRYILHSGKEVRELCHGYPSDYMTTKEEYCYCLQFTDE
jgi:hypothetical protein